MKEQFSLVLAISMTLGCHGEPSSRPDDAIDRDAAADGTVPAALRPSDLARRLALFLWETEPDADLLRTLETSPPANRDAIRMLATTMLADPRARVMVASFFRQWLQLDSLGTATKDPTLYPEFTSELRADLIAEATRMTTFVTFDGDGRFPTLFTTDISFVSERLAQLYGVATTQGQNLVQTTLDPTQRSGVLTLAGVLANQPDTNEPPHTRRGIFVNSLLCSAIPPAPQMNVAVTPPSNQSTRDWLLGFDSNASCAGCHLQTDPFGVALGQYDALGRFQTTERGFAIDPSASWAPPGESTIVINGARALATLLADRADVRSCFVKRWLKFATGLDTADGDPSVLQASGAFLEANLDIRTLIVAITTTDAFLATQVPGGGG